MSQIKVIKKKVIAENSQPVRNARERSAIDFELSDTVKSWVADWRTRKDVERESALKELTRFKQQFN